MREEYIEIRKSIFESLQKGEQPKLSIEFFYKYYLQEFENQPKTKLFPKTDMMGNIIFNEGGNIVLEERDVELIPLHIFSQQFGMLLMASFNDVFDWLDKIFHISWLCDSQGNKLKLVI